MYTWFCAAASRARWPTQWMASRFFSWNYPNPRMLYSAMHPLLLSSPPPTTCPPPELPPYKLETNATAQIRIERGVYDLWNVDVWTPSFWRSYFLQTLNYSFLWNSLNNYLISIKSSSVIIFDKVILSPIYYLDITNWLPQISFTVNSSSWFVVC